MKNIIYPKLPEKWTPDERTFYRMLIEALDALSENVREKDLDKALKALLSGFSTGITGANTTLAGLQGTLSDINTALGNAEGALESANTAIGNANTAIERIDGAVADANTAIQAADAAIEALEGQVGGIHAGHTYATGETLTGDVWTNGKPIYAFTAIVAYPTAGAWVEFNLGSDVETVVRMEGVLQNAEFAFPTSDYGTADSRVRQFAQCVNGVWGGRLRMQGGTGTFRATYYYTKTTDSGT